MTASYFTITGDARVSLLSRLLGYLAQHDLQAPDLSVVTRDDAMVVRLVTQDLAAPLARIISSKMASLVGVQQVSLEFAVRDDDGSDLEGTCREAGCPRGVRLSGNICASTRTAVY